MRLIPTLLLALALATAGCLGGDDETTPPPTDDGTTPPEDGGTTPPEDEETPPEDEETPPEDEAPPEPTEVFSDSYDFQSGDATGSEPGESRFNMPEGFNRAEMTVTFTPTGVTLGNTMAVSLHDAEGGELVRCTSQLGQTDPVECVADTSIPGAGEWSVQYHGAGTVTASVSIMASA